MQLRVLLSVYDKTGIPDLARNLHELGAELVSSGGTADAIKASRTPVTEVSTLTGIPAILDHRVVTLHPKIHGGLLGDPGNPVHRGEMRKYGIEHFDLAVLNLYPFRSNPSIPQIDIGGPAMVRAAAKNHASVGVVVDPDDYELVLEELEHYGALTAKTRLMLAGKAFAHTAAYEAAIANWFAQQAAEDGDLPERLFLALEQAGEPLRYGENPHQRGARYQRIGEAGWWDGAVQLGGKPMSLLNLRDAEAAARLVHNLNRAGVAIIKHANPSGVAVQDDLTKAYKLALSCDSDSAFGGIVAVNHTVTEKLAKEIIKLFTEVVIAPGFDDEALAILRTKENLRIIRAPEPPFEPLHMQSIAGGLLIQETDRPMINRTNWEVVTEAKLETGDDQDVDLAWRVSGHVTSNSIVLVKNGVAWGIGAGQQKRVDSARIATEKADGRAKGGVMASEAFLPQPDSLDVAAEAGVRIVVQTGGSVRDEEVIARANELGLVMIFTGERHFRH